VAQIRDHFVPRGRCVYASCARLVQVAQRCGRSSRADQIEPNDLESTAHHALR
jgi:hypothetical protein